MAVGKSAEPIAGSALSSGGSPTLQGVIEAGLPEFRLELMGLNGLLKVQGQEGRALVPQGRYYVTRWVLARRDRLGRLWEATFSPVQRQWFEVGAEPVRLEMSGDLTAVPVAELRGATAHFMLRFEGGAGGLQMLTVDGVKPPPPALRIVDDRGKTVIRLPSKYG